MGFNSTTAILHFGKQIFFIHIEKQIPTIRIIIKNDLNTTWWGEHMMAGGLTLHISFVALG